MAVQLYEHKADINYISISHLSIFLISAKYLKPETQAFSFWSHVTT